MNCHGWNISSSEDDEESILPAKRQKKFLSPTQLKNRVIQKNVKMEQKEVTAKAVKHCPYGKNCYRKNPEHFKEFFHPLDTQQAKDQFSSDVLGKSHGSAISGAQNNQPAAAYSSSVHGFLLTTVNGISDKFNYVPHVSDHELICPPSVTISDILSQKFGRIERSAQFNYCIDIAWLMDQYPKGVQNCPLLIVHGCQGRAKDQLKDEAKAFPNIDLCRAELPPYGTHHTKMMLLQYHHGLRIVIGTANLVESDWKQKTQGLWISPVFPLSSSKSHTPSCDFQQDLILYLEMYKRKVFSSWIDLIKQCDMKSANVVLVASVPGRHTGAALSCWGHMRLRKLLSMHVKGVDATWPVVGQFSSIGSLGQNKDKWLCSEWLLSMSASQKREAYSVSNSRAALKLIFPTIDNVRCSLEGYPAGASLPYSAATALKQPWLQQFLHCWVADHTGRSEASPHIKSYMRISPFQTNFRAAWFLLTSANLSKAAWGALEKNGSQLAIKSYELGVLFLPSQGKFHTEVSDVVRDTHFHLCKSSKSPNKFPLPYSLPLQAYNVQDLPWTWDSPHTDAPDRYGNMWVPS